MLQVEYGKEQLMVMQFELETQEEELIELKDQYFKMRKVLNRSNTSMKERHEFQDYIDCFEFQINCKIIEINIKREELW